MNTLLWDVCVFPDPCSLAKNPCNGGTCVSDSEVQRGHRCLCRDGYYGDLCTNSK